MYRATNVMNWRTVQPCSEAEMWRIWDAHRWRDKTKAKRMHEYYIYDIII